MDRESVSDNVCILDLMCKDKYGDANNHKKARDEFSAQSKMWIIRRNNYGAMARENVAKATEAKRERDFFNQKVREAKEKRDECHRKAAELKETGKEGFSELREEGNKYHEEVAENSVKGQAAHEKMITSYEEADVARKLSDAAQKKFTDCRIAADVEHNAYIEKLREIDNLKDNLPEEL